MHFETEAMMTRTMNRTAMPTRRTLCQALALAPLAAPFVSLSVGGPARAEAARYPTRPVRFILPFGAGGVADTTSRFTAEKLGEKLGQRFVIENQPGALGINAARSVITAPADGYTLGLVTNGTAISVPLAKSLPFDPVKDFAMISALGQFDLFFVVSGESKYRTLQEFIQAARERPGKLNVGTINIGGTQNLGAELLKSVAKIDFQVVPFRNSPEIVVGLLRNDVDMMVDFYPAVRAVVQDGKARALAASGPQRSPISPDLPTVREAGLEYEVTSWNGMFAPHGTPAEVIKLLNGTLREILASPEVKKQYADVGIEAKASSPEELEKRLRDDIVKWGQVIERANIPKQ
jgi:tripartite-type tricarboxylate transporter receptor subunit TctC